MENNSLDEAIRAIVKEENSLLYNKIEAVLQNSKVIESQDKPMIFDEAVEYLGCSKSYLYKMTHQRKIPHSKNGKRLLFDRKSLNIWQLQNKVKTVSEIKEEAENSNYKHSKF